jgi:hypothetical protein
MTNRAVFNVEVGFQVFLSEGGEEIGAVREVTPDHLIIYVEGARDFHVPGPAVLAAHDGKVILDPSKIDPAILESARHAHDRESE